MSSFFSSCFDAASIATATDVAPADIFGCTALMLASMKGDEAVALLLLQHGADV